MKSKAKWIIGLVVAGATAIGAYLSQGCTPAQLSKVQSNTALATAVCQYVETRTEPEFDRVKTACAKKADLQAILRAASECK